MSRPLIEDGAVRVLEHRIAAVGRWADLKVHSAEGVLDLGDAALLPGLVNAHCHLDYTKMAGMISPPRAFSDWIKALIAVKASWSYSDYADSWLEGARMLLRNGTTTVGDFEAVPELLPDVWTATPLRVFSFLELTCVRTCHAPSDVISQALGHIQTLRHPRCSAHLGPHAVYSTTPELLGLCASVALERDLLTSMHLGESLDEWEMCMNRRGALFDWLKNQRDASDCGGVTPVEQAESRRLLTTKLLSVHVNHLGPHDARRLRQAGCSVVHCPRSHDYFCHQEFPFEQLKAEGINVCLGTDSLVSVLSSRKQAPVLNLFAEMQRFAQSHPDVSGRDILEMATINGAKALRQEGRLGVIEPGAWADLIALPFSGKIEEAQNAVVNHTGDILASMIAGDWAISPYNVSR